jgi:hydrogenase nickel incorporation protein HypA/HybF
MHELAITQSILDIAQQAAREHGVTRVREVRIKLGAYSGVVPQCVQDYFSIISQGTLAEGAVLNIQTLPVVVHCSHCGQDREIDRRHVRCPVCGGTDLKIIQGREFYVESLEVD